MKPSKDAAKTRDHTPSLHHLAAMTVGGWREAIELCANRWFIDAPGVAMIITSSCLAAFP
jgi:hypothetical protein